MAETAKCTICGDPANLCNGCQAAAYCSLECKQTDAPIHNLLCKSYGEISKDNFASRPSPKHRLVIHLPMNGPNPTLVWVQFEDVGSKEDGVWEFPKISSLIQTPGSTNEPFVKSLEFYGNRLRGRVDNKFAIRVYYNENLLYDDGVRSNQVVYSTFARIMKNGYGHTVTHRGPRVITLTDEPGPEFEVESEPENLGTWLKDMNLTAFRDAVDFLGFYRLGEMGSMFYGNQAMSIDPHHVFNLVGKVTCLRQDRVYDEETASFKPNTKEVSIPKLHPIFSREPDENLPITLESGLRLKVKVYRASEVEASDNSTSVSYYLLPYSFNEN